MFHYMHAFHQFPVLFSKLKNIAKYIGIIYNLKLDSIFNLIKRRHSNQFAWSLNHSSTSAAVFGVTTTGHSAGGNMGMSMFEHEDFKKRDIDPSQTNLSAF